MSWKTFRTTKMLKFGIAKTPMRLLPANTQCSKINMPVVINAQK